MMSRRWAGVAACLVAGSALAPGIAGASIVDRAMLIKACTARDAIGRNNCAGYIAGIADMADSTKDGVCIPKGLTIALLNRGVTTYLQSHTTSDGPAAPAVVDALRNLYRCIG